MKEIVLSSVCNVTAVAAAWTPDIARHWHQDDISNFFDVTWLGGPAAGGQIDYYRSAFGGGFRNFSKVGPPNKNCPPSVVHSRQGRNDVGERGGFVQANTEILV